MKNVPQAKQARHKARRERYSVASPPKALVRIHRKPELIHAGHHLSVAQLRSLYAVTQEMM
ncbi:MAG TPA: hypothetical protein DCS21_05185 [Gammaproteobacteria bacterium]|nr:hypothetical protein [Gammaproteobacteria bacterium]